MSWSTVPNRYGGKCPCGVFVPASKGRVFSRRIHCMPCTSEWLQSRSSASFQVQGFEGRCEELYGGRGMYGFDE